MITFKEHIVKVKGGYRLVSKKTGKNLGTYPSRSGAEKRERQVQYFKHMGEATLKKTMRALISHEILRKLSNFATQKAHNEAVLVKKKLNYKQRSGPSDMAVSTVMESGKKILPAGTDPRLEKIAQDAFAHAADGVHKNKHHHQHENGEFDAYQAGHRHYFLLKHQFDLNKHKRYEDT